MKQSLLLLAGIFLSLTALAQPSHATFNQLLKTHVTPSGEVNYKGVIADKPKLEQYLNTLAKNHPKEGWSKNEKMAYWINAYNAFTISAVIKHYPLKSITEIKPADAENIWKSDFIKIGDKSYSLDHIEHEILRKKFQDPRIHFAVNCASVSCPPLLNEAFHAERLEQQLEQQARRFINASEYNHISSNKLALSSIFSWFKSDFTKNGSLIDYLNNYSAKPINSNATITYKTYDWNLNELH